MTQLIKHTLRIVDECNENHYRLCVDKLKRPSLSLPPSKVKSETLLGRARELVITHNGRDYRLRITQNGKLILTA
jgi:hemin uptake protein HemP